MDFWMLVGAFVNRNGILTHLKEPEWHTDAIFGQCFLLIFICHYMEDASKVLK